MSDTSDEVEEVPRAFPPPEYTSYRYKPILPKVAIDPTATRHLHPYPPPPPPYRYNYLTPPNTAVLWVSPPDLPPKFQPQLDGHVSSSDQKSRRRRKEPEMSEESDVEVTINHYCARCGRARSRHFQRVNPVRPGDTPHPGICKRCIQPGLPPPKPKVEVPKKERRQPRVDEEVEEILIRRGPTNPIARYFQNPYVEKLRIRRHTHSASPPPAPTRRRRSSSADEVKTRTRRSSEEVPDPRGRLELDDEPLLRVRVRSTSRQRGERRATRGHPELYDCQFEPTRIRSPSPPKGNWPSRPLKSAPYVTDEDVDRLISSHPSPWSHGRIVTVLRKREGRPASCKEVTEPPEPPKPPAPPPPPEWYYRQVRRVLLPDPGSRSYRPATYETKQQRDDKKDQRRLESPAVAPGAPWDKHNPVRDLLQRSRQERLNIPNDLYGAERERYRRFGTQVSSESEEERVRERRVRFASPRTRYRNGNGQKALARQREAIRDKQEEDHDQHDFDHAKKAVRHRMYEGGGKLELLDGHYSEDAPRGKPSGLKRFKPIYGRSDEQTDGVFRDTCDDDWSPYLSLEGLSQTFTSAESDRGHPSIADSYRHVEAPRFVEPATHFRSFQDLEEGKMKPVSTSMVVQPGRSVTHPEHDTESPFMYMWEGSGSNPWNDDGTESLRPEDSGSQFGGRRATEEIDRDWNRPASRVESGTESWDDVSEDQNVRWATDVIMRRRLSHERQTGDSRDSCLD